MKCVFAIFLIAYVGHSNMSSIELNFKVSSGGSHKSKTGGFHIKSSWSAGEVKSDVLQCGAKLHGFLHGIEWIMFHGHLDCFQKPPLGGRPNRKSGDRTLTNVDLFYFMMW